MNQLCRPAWRSRRRPREVQLFSGSCASHTGNGDTKPLLAVRRSMTSNIQDPDHPPAPSTRRPYAIIPLAGRFRGITCVRTGRVSHHACHPRPPPQAGLGSPSGSGDWRSGPPTTSMLSSTRAWSVNPSNAISSRPTSSHENAFPSMTMTGLEPLALSSHSMRPTSRSPLVNCHPNSVCSTCRTAISRFILS